MKVTHEVTQNMFKNAMRSAQKENSIAKITIKYVEVGEILELETHTLYNSKFGDDGRITFCFRQIKGAKRSDVKSIYELRLNKYGNRQLVRLY